MSQTTPTAPVQFAHVFPGDVIYSNMHQCPLSVVLAEPTGRTHGGQPVYLIRAVDETGSRAESYEAPARTIIHVGRTDTPRGV